MAISILNGEGMNASESATQFSGSVVDASVSVIPTLGDSVAPVKTN